MIRFWISIGYISSAALIGMGIYRLLFYNEFLPQIFLGIMVFLMVSRAKKG